MKRTMALVPALLTAWTPFAFANPVFSHAESGVVTIDETGSVYTIHSSDRAIGAFDSFSNAAGESIVSIQASPDHTALFRVTGQDPSVILGSLTANSRIFLLNPNGVVFGQGARIDAPGLTASALEMANEDFLAGNYVFFDVEGPGGSVTNEGTIRASEYAALVGRSVKNTGTIEAPDITLAAGGRVRLALDADGLVSVSVDAAALGASIENAGRLAAEGGSVTLTARAADAVFDHVINHTGVIEARSVGTRNGNVVLYGGDEGVVEVSGAIDADGEARILGDRVGLTGQAVVDAPSVLVGGDYQGTNSDVPNADFTYVGPDTLIRGDRVIVWADGATLFYGTIDATGGFVETSGKAYLESTGTVLAGTWLLDPEDLTITTSTTNITDDSGAITRTFSPSAPGAILNATTVNNALNAGTNVVITTNVAGSGSGDIFVNSSISTTSGANLTLDAARHILVNSVITMSTGTLTLTAGGNLQGIGGGAVGNGAADIATSGGVFITADGVGTTNQLEIGFTNGTGSQTLEVESTAAVAEIVNMEVIGDNFDVYKIIQADASSPIDIDLPGSDVIDINAGAVLNNITLNSTSFDADFDYQLTEAVDVLVGSITLDSAKTLTMQSADGILDSSSSMTAGTMVLTAGGADGDVGVTTARLNTQATSITATATGTGEIGLNETNGVTLTLTANGGAINVTTNGNTSIGATITTDADTNDLNLIVSSGDITARGITTGGASSDVLLNATAGSIVDDGSSSTKVVADNLVMTATGGIGSADAVEIDANTLDATVSSAGNIRLAETGAITLTDVDASDGFITITAGGTMTVTDVEIINDADANDVTLTSSGTMTVGTLDANTAGDLTLTSTAGSILDGTGLITGDALTLSANGSVGVSATKLTTQVNTLSASTTSGGIFILESTGVTIPSLTASGGEIVFTVTAGNIVLGVASAGLSNNVTIETVAGSITDANAGDLNVTADTVFFGASGNVGTSGDPIEVTVNTIDVSGVTGSSFVVPFVPPSSNTAGLTISGGRITGGENIEELASSLYGEESESSEEGGEENEDDAEKAKDAASSSTEGGSLNDPSPGDVPPLTARTLSPCGIG